MKPRSAGLLLYRYRDGIEVLIAHPGGPFWKNKNMAAWSIPKGEYLAGEDPLRAAIREFHEEIGTIVSGKFTELKPVKMSSGKIVTAYAVAYDLDVTEIRSNTFEMEWPPRSGKVAEFPEIDRAEWVSIETARERLHAYQVAFIDQLESLLSKK